MGKVQLKIPPWVAIMLNEQGSDWFILEKEIGEGATIGDLLADLASDYTDFRKVLFNPDIGKVSDQVNVILNNNLLQSTDMTEAKLNDGDTVTLLPVYTGG
ncbi:MoaD/ThiS family protein [Chloroflexota bacterium]